MENLYLFFVIVLIILAASDLVVGVTNDAANFLNSAIGSKVAPLKVILGIAALGVVVGATFSSGMMEIARSGIFHPDQFYFSEIMIIFLAVMITDVILLDTFNTFGLPTSTTVSIVFELLGAAVAVSLIKISGSEDNLVNLGTYINSARALAIISGILLSVVIAFTVGSLVQFVTRLIFSFNYERTMKYFGALWGGVAITGIVYFMLVKGAKGASFMTPESVAWLEANTTKLLLYSFVVFAAILQFLMVVFRTNILRVIVLIGTFSLAMAFAGNDLVNFIGVPLAGLESLKHIINDPGFSPDTYLMTELLNPVKTPTLYLLIAGFIMVLALFFSKKARTVSMTEVNLARQDIGAERFSSSMFSRSIVRSTVEASKFLSRIIPDRVISFIEKRFDSSRFKKRFKSQKDASSFDQLRASVNMFVASMLIATATSLKLPLSTTYVTFMVAMGTSLSDRAWGRESAVYRITGVITVIGGWFFTAFTAFTVSFLIANFLHWGGLTATIVSLCIAVLFIVRTHFLHKERETKRKKKDEFDEKESLNGDNIVEKCSSTITSTVISVSKLYFSTLLHLIREDRKKTKKTLIQINELNQYTKDLKYNLYPTLKKLEEDFVETGHHYVQILDYLREIAHCLKYIADPVYEHLDNNHPPLIPDQVKDLHELNESISTFYNYILNVTKKQNFRDIDSIFLQQQSILELIAKLKKKQVKLIKAELVGTRNTLMYLNLLAETKNLILYSVNMVKAHRDFILSESKKPENKLKGK